MPQPTRFAGIIYFPFVKGNLITSVPPLCKGGIKGGIV